MPNRPKQKNSNRKFEFENSILDELLTDYEGPDDMFGSEGLLENLKARLIERALQGEMTHHLGYEKNAQRPEGTTNYRNGSSPKTIKTETGQMEIQIPLDRECTFEPILVPKGVRRLEGFDDMVLSLYARGMGTRDILLGRLIRLKPYKIKLYVDIP